MFQITPHYLDLCCQTTCVHVIGCTTIFPPFKTMSVCFMICLCSLVAYITNNMDRDQTAPSPRSSLIRFIVFASMVIVF